MPRIICKLDGLYFEWSTIVDAPLTYGMTLDEFTNYYRGTYGTEGLATLPERLTRVEAKGCSSLLHTSIDDLIAWNRAGEDEAVATRAELIAMLRPAPAPKEKP